MNGSPESGLAPSPQTSTPVLHVLAGPNKGAESPLGEGDWTIGSGPDADLTFSEPSLVAAHVRLRRAGAAVRIVALADGVRLGSLMLEPGTEQELLPLTPVALGTTEFAIGPPGTAWDQVQAAPPPAPAPSVEVAVATPSTLSVPANVALEAAPARPPKRWLLWLSAPVAATLLAGAGVAWWATRPEPVQHAPPTTSPLERAQSAIAKLGLAESVTARRSGDRVAVVGHVKSSVQETALAESLRRADVPADISVTTDAMFADLAGIVARAYAAQATVKVTGPWQIELEGFAPAGTNIDELLRRLRTDVPGVRSVTDRIVTPERAREFLDEGLRTAGLADALRVSATTQGFRVVGSGGPGVVAKWDELAQRFKQRYGQWLSVQADILPPASIEPSGVSLGRNPQLVMSDGMRLGVGDQLGGAGRIVAISASRVRVSSPSGEIDLPYAHPPNWIMEDTSGGN